MKTTLAELLEMIHMFCPNAIAGEDLDGQIVIYTGTCEDSDNDGELIILD